VLSRIERNLRNVVMRITRTGGMVHKPAEIQAC
jgi:hypothetical protein